MPRYIARLPQRAMPGYHELDERLARRSGAARSWPWWGKPTHLYHPEHGGAATRRPIERTVFASAALRF